MELNQIIAFAVSALLGIGVVWKVVSKFSGKAEKAVAIAKEALDLLNAALVSIKDSKVDEKEIQAIRKEANDLLLAFQALKEKK